MATPTLTRNLSKNPFKAARQKQRMKELEKKYGPLPATKPEEIEQEHWNAMTEHAKRMACAKVALKEEDYLQDLSKIYIPKAANVFINGKRWEGTTYMTRDEEIQVQHMVSYRNHHDATTENGQRGYQPKITVVGG